MSVKNVMKRKIISDAVIPARFLVPAVGFAAALAFAVPVTAAEVTEKTGFARCEEYLNVRSDASVEGEIVGKLYNNGKVEILETITEETEDGPESAWYHIRSGNVDGYVAADWIATGEEAQEIAQTAGYTTAECGAWAANVHTAMSDESEVVGTIYENRSYEVVDDQGDWIKVITGDGTYGWVSADYVYTSTEYGTAETPEEEQQRLDEQWLEYLAQQEEASGAAAPAQQEMISQAESAAADAQAQAWSAVQEAEQAQAQADADYQAYLEAQAAADNVTAESGTQEAVDAQNAAQDAYQAFEASQAAADAQYQEADAAQTAADEAQYAADSLSDPASAETGSDGITYNTEEYAEYETVSGTGDAYTEDTYTETYAEDTYTEDTYTEDTYTEDTYTEDTSAQQAAASSTGQAIANYACQFVGNPYVYGGTSLTSGADCSGFVMSVCANFGISLPHNAAAQSGYGTSVDASSLAPGDLVFYSDGSGISHVAIYIGGGSIVHAANSASGICYGNLNYNTPVAYRRVA